MKLARPGPPSVLGQLRGLPLRLTLWVLVFGTAGYVVCAALLIRGDTQERVLRMDGELRMVTAAVQRLVTEEQVQAAISSPPTDTRAYFRGECLRRFGKDVAAASWDSVTSAVELVDALSAG